MKNWIRSIVVISAIAMLFTVGCDRTESKTESTVLIEYLIDNDLDLSDILNGWIITAKDVHDNLGDYYVIDVRSQASYDAGHIPGAVFADASTILNVAGNSNGKTILVHCYKGIGATRLLVALRLSGYTTAKSLKFGMSAWGPADADSGAAYDKWTGAVSDTALSYPADWLTTASTPATDIEYEYPELSTGEDEGADILASRVATLLSDGYGYATAPDILVNRGDYFINNYWDETSWDHYGHIAGAHRVFGMSLENGGIDNMNPDETIVTYCWTSQTSGVITAYLTVLGYDAQSLMLGTNGMIYSNLETHAWGLGANVNVALGVTAGANAPGDYELE
ncbi:MAG: rhodanese-like domain-containing protein [Candidatus Marinimicrobia bacterium]|nr:rhodanese-like domain-containing protein [Candidatus Neomarinimicrobiota bacterium]